MPHTYDVLVAGGGLAGCAAALASVREGARTLLVEQAACLGGNATRGMVAPWQSYHASRPDPQSSELPVQVIGGIAQEFVDDLQAQGASLGHIVDPIGFAGSLTPVDSEALKLYLPSKLSAAGVEIRLGQGVDRDLLDSAARVVDASGSCVAARLLGAKCRLASERQPLTWMFTLEGVDTEEIRDYQLAHPGQFVLHPRIRELRSDFVAVSGFFDLWRGGRERGEITIPRDRLLCFSTPRPGEVLVNSTRVPADHPQPRLEGLRQVRELLDWLPRHIPGFANARLGRVADDIGERESWRLEGKYELSVEDLLSGRDFKDSIARGCYPIDIHSATTDELATRELEGRGWYSIPLRCLESPQTDRLLVAGRCISADRSGFASARTLPTAMALGQVAGMLSALRALGKKAENLTCLSAVARV
ncbi:FAD-dependent oxidoreductase [bacterium]|nr:FAD-dependent oxidoreductase [bacterium]